MIVSRQLQCSPVSSLHKIRFLQARSRSLSSSNINGIRIQTRSHFNSRNYGCAVNVFNEFKTLLSNSRMTTVCFRQQRFVSNVNSKMQLTMNNVNRNVSENILIFSQENDSFYKFLSIFGVFQMILWGYLSLSPVQNLRPGPMIDKKNDVTDMPWWKRWLYKEGQYKNAISGIFLTVGVSILFVSLTYPRRAVKSLWLLKGGRHVKIITHSPFKSSQSFSVPLDNVNCLQARTGSGTQIPMKLKNKSFFFLMDKQGTFHHPEMFDFVIGLKRNL